MLCILQNVTAEDVKFNTTLPATSFGKELNATALPGIAEREVNEPIVIFMGHSDSEELSENESSELPKFTSLPYFGLHPEIRSSNRQENSDITFLGVMGYYGIASRKTVPKYHDTVTSLDREEDDFSLLHWEGLPLRKLIPRKRVLHCSRRTLRLEPLLFWMNCNLP